jgi:hypothetical protein
LLGNTSNLQEKEITILEGMDWFNQRGIRSGSWGGGLLFQARRYPDTIVTGCHQYTNSFTNPSCNFYIRTCADPASNPIGHPNRIAYTSPESNADADAYAY